MVKDRQNFNEYVTAIEARDLNLDNATWDCCLRKKYPQYAIPVSFF